MNLQDQRVLATGATAGTGRETATLPARRGATVVITGTDPGPGAQAVAAIQAGGGRAGLIAAGLNDIAPARRLAGQAGEAGVLVNNAAAHYYAPALEQDAGSFDMTFGVTATAPFFLTAALPPEMTARRIGRHRQHLRRAGFVRRRRRRGGLRRRQGGARIITRCRAVAFGGRGIRVNTIAPGSARTDSVIGTPGDKVEQLGSATPPGRTADPRRDGRGPSSSPRRRKRATSPARP